MQSVLPEFIAGIPEIFLALIGMVLLMYGVFRKNDSLTPLTYMTIASFFVAIVLVNLHSSKTELGFNELFLSNHFTQFCKVLILLSSSAVLLMSIKHLEKENINRFEYPVLALFATLGMLMMVSANDLISLFIGLELQSLTLYVMVAIRIDKVKASEAGLKYFILGAISTAFILYGSSIVYGYTGTTNFQGILQGVNQIAEMPVALTVAFIMLIAGMAFKVSLAPFHMWTPDVYEGSPTPVTAFLAAAPKIAAFALFVRLIINVFDGMEEIWQTMLVGLSLSSMLIGAFTALFQKNIKRLLAYSTISHMGYAILGLLGGVLSGVESVLVYLAIYAVMTIGAFACLLNLRSRGQLVESISDLAGISKESPVVAGCFTVLLFSLAGIPPLAGFFAKLHVFLAAVDAGYTSLAIIGLLSSVVAAGYYLKVIKVMYFDAPIGGENSTTLDVQLSRETLLVMSVSVVFVLAYVIFPDYIMSKANAAAVSLFIKG